MSPDGSIVDFTEERSQNRILLHFYRTIYYGILRIRYALFRLRIYFSVASAVKQIGRDGNDTLYSIKIFMSEPLVKALRVPSCPAGPIFGKSSIFLVLSFGQSMRFSFGSNALLFRFDFVLVSRLIFRLIRLK